MMKPLIVIAFLATSLAAQTSTDKTFSIPDFKVTAESLAKAQKRLPMTFIYPPELRKGPPARLVIAPQTCLTMHSYNFDNSATPKLVSETNCTIMNKNGFLRVQR